LWPSKCAYDRVAYRYVSLSLESLGLEIKRKKKYHTAGIVPKSNRYMVKLIPLTHTFPGLAQPLQQNVSGGIKLLSWEQMFNLREMRRSNLSKIPTLTYIRKNSIIIKNAVILNIIFNIFIFVIQKLSHVYYEVY
jgi:hypothetical protein